MDLIKEIKEKKELKSLPNELIDSVLKNYLQKNKIKDAISDKNKKIIIKEVRSELRKYTGQYVSNSDIKSRPDLLKEQKFEDLLGKHKSTKERFEDYLLVKEMIQKINPSTILDLGCGLNPLAIANDKTKYYAYDINSDDLEVVKGFFKSKKIQGFTFHEDIRKIEKFPKIDLCIIFKVLDILGDNRNEISKELMEKIDSKYFIVSFATRTLSGKPMNSPYRRWFENILKSLNYSYQVKRTKQELFYIIQK